MNISDLPDLIDVFNQIIPEDDTNFFEEDDAFELYITCIHLMEDFIQNNPKLITDPDFDEIFNDIIQEEMHVTFETDILYTDEAEEDMEEIIEHAKTSFFKDYIPPRSYSTNLILKDVDKEYVTKQLQYLRNKPQPTQRTKEWYEFRHNLITASNAYKAFENQTTQNQLIFEKCKPLNSTLYIDGEDTECIKEIQFVNVNSTLHWGQKYEPLSVKFYEHTYNTTVEDFGCIQHDTYKFIGASPDGICSKYTLDNKFSDRLGTMLEIKCPVTRDIHTKGKIEGDICPFYYYCQVQQQLVCCELDVCDFWQCKILEYKSRNEYLKDKRENTKHSNGIVYNKTSKPEFIEINNNLRSK